MRIDAETDPLVDCLDRIVLSDDPEDITRAWKTLEELENSSYDCNRNYDKLLKYVLTELNIKNIYEMPRMLEWFSKFPLTNSASKLISDDIAFFLQCSARDFRTQPCLAEIIQVINDNHEKYLPYHYNHVKLCKSIVEVLAYMENPKLGKLHKHNNDLRQIHKFLKMMTDNQVYDSTENIALSCFIKLCEIFLKNDPIEEPSYALIFVLQVVKEDLWKAHMNIAVNKILEEFKHELRIVNMLTVFCKWLTEPSVPNDQVKYLSVWLTLFMKGLKDNKRIRIVSEVAEKILPTTLKKCLKMESKFFNLAIQDDIILTLLDNVLSLGLHHKIMRVIMNFLQLQNCKGPVSEKKEKILVTLFDYVDVLMKRFDRHLENRCHMCEMLKQMINQFVGNEKENNPIVTRYIAEESEDMEISYPSTSSGHGRINTGKVGLCNLGNTCYMNSVLQALVMTRQFCREVLLYKSSNDLSDQVVLKNLQNLFAMLKYSKKSSLAPTEILQASRPSYFMLGHQQDSSEFLCHVLDVLYEQEKSALSQSSSSSGQNVGTAKITIEDKEMTDVGETTVAGSSNSPDSDESKTKITRWTTEENLSEGASLQRKTQSLADFTQGEELAQTQNGLSDSHSDSTDSGIQSVGGEDSTSSTSSAIPSPSSPSLSYLVHRVFGGELQITYHCDKCHTESVNKDKFCDLQLCFLEDLTTMEPVTVQELINRNYLTPERLTGDNKYRCDKCAGLCDAQRIIKISQAPDHLILTLKHFRYDSESRLRAKLRRKVSYDETIKLPVFERDNETYQLYAAVVHSGYSMDYGHYVTYACDSQNNWYKFNDSLVSDTTIEDFKRLEPPDTPYILFYKRCTGASNEHDELALTDLPEDLQEYVQKVIYEDQRRAKLASARQNSSSFSLRRSWDRDKKNEDDDDDNGGHLRSSCRDAINIPNQPCLF